MVKKYFILNSHFTFWFYQKKGSLESVGKKSLNRSKQVNNDNNDLPLLSKYDNNNEDHNFYLENGNYHNNPPPKRSKENDGNKHPYVKVLVDDPYNNRNIILNVTKKQKGVYVWETLDGKDMYVGHSINLYNRICSYFMPSILNSKARRVLRYLNKYGFSKIKLTIYIMGENSSLNQVVELEQHFMDSLKPNLNVDQLARGSGYHEPLSSEMRDKLRKMRGTPIYMYCAKDFTLLYIFESKQQVYNIINIHHVTLSNCLNIGNIYLDTFFFSLDIIEESPETNLLDLDQIKSLVLDKREIYKVKHPAAKSILGEFKDDAKKNIEFYSLNSLAKHLKGDRQVIRKYLTGQKSGYYRGKWKFTWC